MLSTIPISVAAIGRTIRGSRRKKIPPAPLAHSASVNDDRRYIRKSTTTAKRRKQQYATSYARRVAFIQTLRE